MTDPVEAVTRSYDLIEASERTEVWIAVRPRAEALADAERVRARLAAGEVLPLAGLTVGVKDNIDVAGVPTTAGCPAFSFVPTVSTLAVSRLQDAGAVIIGKTALDQFATGLSGARSPHGPVRNALDARYISGGSSSGSGVAVALGQVDLGLGTDTAGSGRVPAALNGIVGIKPTFGLIPATGVLPACRSLDCVTMFARTVTTAAQAIEVMAGADRADARSRPDSRAGIVAPTGSFRFGVAAQGLDGCDPLVADAVSAAVGRLEALGGTAVVVDLGPFLAAGRLLYGGSFVAERYAAVGAFVEHHAEQVEPTVRDIILRSGRLMAHKLAADQEQLQRLRQAAADTFDGIDLLVLPTTPTTFTIDEMLAEPVERNAALGRLGEFANLLDLCCTVVPLPRADGLSAGVSLMAPAWHDHVVTGLAARLLGEPVPPPPMAGTVPLAVVGAHLAGQPLHHQLSSRRAVHLATTTTSPAYRLHTLRTEPPKPGLVRVADGGSAIEVEVYTLTAAAFGSFVADVPAPMAIGTVELADGTWVKGFVCEPLALHDAPDISSHGGWRAFLGAAGG